MSANDRQVGGNHYGGKEMQHWDVVHIFNLDYFQGQITKYLFRWKQKDGIKDLQKAQHFLEKYIELHQADKKVPNLTEAQYAEAVRIFQLEGQFGDGRAKIKCKKCNQYLWGYSSQAEAWMKHLPECPKTAQDARGVQQAPPHRHPYEIASEVGSDASDSQDMGAATPAPRTTIEAGVDSKKP